MLFVIINWKIFFSLKKTKESKSFDFKQKNQHKILTFSSCIYIYHTYDEV